MSWSQHLRSAQDFMKVGDEVEAVILTLDREERKMSLGIKQLKADPWENIEEKYPVGSKHTAKVRNFTNFGVFVELEEGVDGLIHISDLSGPRRSNTRRVHSDWCRHRSWFLKSTRRTVV
jgi:small subunit ribosomal protein S1